MAHKGEYGEGMEAGGDYGFKMARDRNAKMMPYKGKGKGKTSHLGKKKRKIPTVISGGGMGGY